MLERRAPGDVRAPHLRRPRHHRQPPRLQRYVPVDSQPPRLPAHRRGRPPGGQGTRHVLRAPAHGAGAGRRRGSQPTRRIRAPTRVHDVRGRDAGAGGLPSRGRDVPSDRVCIVGSETSGRVGIARRLRELPAAKRDAPGVVAHRRGSSVSASGIRCSRGRAIPS